MKLLLDESVFYLGLHNPSFGNKHFLVDLNPKTSQKLQKFDKKRKKE